VKHNGGRKNNFNTEEPEKKNLRTQEVAWKICVKTKKFEISNTEGTIPLKCGEPARCPL